MITCKIEKPLMILKLRLYNQQICLVSAILFSLSQCSTIQNIKLILNRATNCTKFKLYRKMLSNKNIFLLMWVMPISGKLLIILFLQKKFKKYRSILETRNQLTLIYNHHQKFNWRQTKREKQLMYIQSTDLIDKYHYK